ncbi:transposable element Tc1 transposase [Trichonephila clavipes]|nr:transposable element Tc1 transposase [Trichonephila clavipes]
MNFLTAYQTIPWLAISPDHSPIEHVWDIMGRRLHLPGNVNDLAQQLEKIGQEISQETIRVLYHSMSRRVATCIQARGASTPYGARYFGLGSNSGEDIGVCKCIVPSRHGGSLNSRRAASPLVRLVEEKERWEAPGHPRCPPLKLGFKRTKSYSHLYGAQSYCNDRRHLALCHDEFRGPRSGLCR